MHYYLKKTTNQKALIVARPGFYYLFELFWFRKKRYVLPADQSDPGYPGSISPIHPVEKER